MHALIFGAGAVGGYLGGKLIQAGHQITFLGRRNSSAQLNRDGLVLIDDNRHYLTNFKAIHQWPPPAKSRPDIVLLTVKAFDCRQAAEQLTQTNWNIPVVSFINGIGSEAMLAERLPSGWTIIAGTLTTAVERPSPNEILVSKARGAGLQAGSPAAGQLAAALQETGMKVALIDNAEAMKWSKLISNLIGNATAALTGLTVDEIYGHPGLFRLELQALREADAVMTAKGIPAVNLPGVPTRWLVAGLRLPARLLQPLLQRLVAGGRGGKRPSMYYDVSRGKTEVDWLNGAVVQAGQQLGVATPANSLLTASIHQLQPGERVNPSQLLKQAGAAGVPGLARYNRPGN